MLKPIEYKWVKMTLEGKGEKATSILNKVLGHGWVVHTCMPGDYGENDEVFVWTLLMKQENVEEEEEAVLGPRGFCGNCGEPVMVGNLHHNKTKSALRLQGGCSSCGRIEFFEDMPDGTEPKEHFQERMRNQVLETFRMPRKNIDRMKPNTGNPVRR
jgi:ribosomal protein S27AE